MNGSAFFVLFKRKQPWQLPHSDYLCAMNIILFNRDELFVIALNAIAYFKAEDHYTCAYYINGDNMLLPFGLSEIEEKINSANLHNETFMRVGRSFILNLQNIRHISLLKEELTFVNGNGKSVRLYVSKRLLRNLAKHLKGETNLEDEDFLGEE